MTKVLLVEDDKSLREIYAVRLVEEGYDIVSAGDGEEALAMAIKDRPGLIISDVMMPKISGFDMLDILRSTTETKNIKVIMMTALSSEDQRQRGQALGADRYLVKSQVGIEDVVRTVHEVLGDAPVAGQAPLVAKPTPAPTTGTAPAPAGPAPITPAGMASTPSPSPSPAPTPTAPSAPAPTSTPAAPAVPKPSTPTPAPSPAMPGPGPQPASTPSPSPTPAPDPAVATPSTPAPSSDPAPSAPVPTPTPAPSAPAAAPAPAAPQATPAPSADLPQPTAPFSTPRTTGNTLAGRVIEPIQSPTNDAPDLGKMMEQALADKPGDNSTPADAPPTSPTA